MAVLQSSLADTTLCSAWETPFRPLLVYITCVLPCLASRPVPQEKEKAEVLLSLPATRQVLGRRVRRFWTRQIYPGTPTPGGPLCLQAFRSGCPAPSAMSSAIEYFTLTSSAAQQDRVRRENREAVKNVYMCSSIHRQTGW